MTSSNPRKEIIQEVLSEYPDSPKKTLSRLLHEKYPNEFPSIEKARDSIRYYTGASGKSRRSKIPKEDVDLRPHCTLKIPKGTRQTKRPLVITTSGNWFMSSDWHIPFHDETALEAAVKTAVDSKCEHLYINGDAIDFYRSSQWCKDPRQRNLDYELKQLWEVLDQVTPHFPGRKVFKMGNHENRFTRRLWERTPELAVLQRFDVDRVLELRERGFEIIDSSQYAKMNGLHVFHGHELARGFIAPVNVARGLWLKTNSRAICGHYHRASSHVETAGAGTKVISAYSLGCLCNLAPEFCPINKWNHGFSIINLDRKTFRVSNKLIDRGQVFPV